MGERGEQGAMFMALAPPDDDDAAGWKELFRRRSEEYNQLAAQTTEAWAERDEARSQLTELQRERDEAREEYESERAEAIGYSWEASEWKSRLKAAQSEAACLRGALEAIKQVSIREAVVGDEGYVEIESLVCSALSTPPAKSSE